MMILSAYLGEAGFFRWASWRVLRAVSGPRTLLWALVFTAGVLSAFLVNDTVCLMVTPDRPADRGRRGAPAAALPARASPSASNAGSVATLTGNPQNMIVGTLSGISYLGTFAGALALPALVVARVVAAVLHALFRRDLRPGRPRGAPRTEPPRVERRLLAKALARRSASRSRGSSLGLPALLDRALRRRPPHGGRGARAARGARPGGLAAPRLLRGAVRRRGGSGALGGRR